MVDATSGSTEASTSANVIDATPALAQRANQRRTLLPDTAEPLTYDVGLLAVFDTSPLDSVAYQVNRDDYLKSRTREGVQGLVNALWERPTKVIDGGVMAQLPDITTVLPREKPLPKAKAVTKWEKFAKTKGIAPKPKRDRKVFDEEKQDYVPRYGYKGKNKEGEQAWAVEYPANADADFNPRAKAKDERKERLQKNQAQQAKNASRSSFGKANGKKRRSA